MRDRVVTDPRSSAAPARALSRRPLHRRRSDEDRPPQGRALAARRRRGRHRLDGRRRRAAASSCPTSNRSIGNSAPAACCRRTGVLMQNRGASFSLKPARSIRSRPAGCRSTRSIRRSRSSKTAASWPMAHGRRRPAADARRAVHPPCAFSASRSLTRSTVRAGFWAEPGARRGPRCGWNRASTAISSTRSPRPATMSRFCPTPIPTSMGHAGAAVLHPDGTCEGAHDPRADGGAAGV